MSLVINICFDMENSVEDISLPEKSANTNKLLKERCSPILEILRSRKGMIFAVLLAAGSATGGCGKCSCNEKDTESYFGCDAENNRIVCGTRKTDNNNRR
jgi:hypothetical protein